MNGAKAACEMNGLHNRRMQSTDLNGFDIVNGFERLWQTALMQQTALNGFGKRL
jgi:hypothetical protein